MLQLTLQSGECVDGRAELFTDFQADDVNFTVIVNNKQQYNFSMDIKEWESFKLFIDSEIKNNSNPKEI